MARKTALAGAYQLHPRFVEQTGLEALETEDDVETFARWFLGRKGVELQKTTRKVTAYVNDGRWVADCDCGGGMLCWPGEKRAHCLDCGASYLVRFPSEQEIAEAEELLLVRPGRANRAWFPDRESVADLREENFRHGLSPLNPPG